MLYGNQGYDQLTGGKGGDIFTLPYYYINVENVYEFDSITDFDASEDKISIANPWDKLTLDGLTNMEQEFEILNVKSIHKANTKKPTNSVKIFSGTEKDIRQHLDTTSHLFAINLSDNSLNTFEKKDDRFTLKPILKFDKSSDLLQITSDNFIMGAKLPSDLIYGTMPL